MSVRSTSGHSAGSGRIGAERSISGKSRRGRGDRGGGGPVERVQGPADGHRDTGEDRGVPQRVGARLRSPQLLDEVEELRRVVALEGDDELLVVESERVGGVDRDLRIAAADLDVVGHDPTALFEWQRIPLALLLEG